MKTKTKMIALEIAVVLCSALLVATLPAIAAEQTVQGVNASASEVTTASEDDYVLGVYGNANEDDTIDMRDLTYVKLIFFGKKPETELADAKYDGKINPLDFIQIKLIIVGKEKELTIVDTADRIVTVKKPVERIVVVSGHSAEAVKLCGAIDKIVGTSKGIQEKKSYYFSELIGKPTVGGWFVEDYEAITSLEPDIVITYVRWPPISEVEEKLNPFGIAVIALEFTNPKILREEITKLGYILDEKENAREYNDWCKKYENSIKSFVDELTEEEKPRVFLEVRFKSLGVISTYGSGSKANIRCTTAGGRNIAVNLPAYPKVDAEWILEENPDVIIKYGPTVIWGWDNTEELEKLLNEIKSRPGWNNINAVKNGRVYVVVNEITEGPDSIVGLAYWTKIFHPEFNLVDPEDIYREYLNEFLDIEYPENLIFVYPKPT